MRRFFCNDQAVADVIYDLELGIPDVPETILFESSSPPIRLDDCDAFVDLLIPIFHRGRLIAEINSIHDIRKTAIQAVDTFYRHQQEKPYPVGLEKELYELKQSLIEQLRSCD